MPKFRGFRRIRDLVAGDSRRLEADGRLEAMQVALGLIAEVLLPDEDDEVTVDLSYWHALSTGGQIEALGTILGVLAVSQRSIEKLAPDYDSVTWLQGFALTATRNAST